jgi:DivIVA domain-containing protein
VAPFLQDLGRIIAVRRCHRPLRGGGVGVGDLPRDPGSDLSRGYDQDEVDAFIDRCAEQIQTLTERIARLEGEDTTRAAAPRGDDDVVLHSVNILTTAQQTADSTVKGADEYGARVMSGARSMHEEARLKAATILDEANRRASATAEKAAAVQGELVRQTVYLRGLRQSTHVQVENFLKGLLDHVTTEYGRADPAAAQAGTQPAVSDRPNPNTTPHHGTPR